MSTEVLMQFLKTGLIDLQGSDEKLEKLEKTSSALSDILEESPSKALSYTYAACDSNMSENDSVIQEAIAILNENWPTYFNTFSGTPVPFIRAILLQALASKLEEDMHIAVAFDSIVKNVIPHTDVGKEGDMWRSLIHDNDLKLNLRAEEEWSAPEQITVEPFSYKPPKSIEISSKEVKLDRESLQTGIEKAFGPTNPAGEKTQGNSFVPQHGKQWIDFLTPILTETIANTIDDALEV